jgi:hypothetical protein
MMHCCEKRYDGTDVLVFDAHGRLISSVAEVRIDFDRAVVALQDAWAWAGRGEPDEVPACAIHSARDGRLHWCGPVRLSLA